MFKNCIHYMNIGCAVLFLLVCDLKALVEQPTFDAWYYDCKTKLTPKSKFNKSTVQIKTTLSPEMFFEVLESYYDAIHDQNAIFSATNKWLGEKTPDRLLAVKRGALAGYAGAVYQPFVEKRVLPVNSRVAIHGDLHGGLFELLEFIKWFKDKGNIDDNFKIVADDFYMMFLGDYTDRGIYGAEVVYTILRLKLANPDRVLIARGNHEDMAMTQENGFAEECKDKFSENYEKLYNAIHYAYESFPVAIFLGSGTEKKYYFQCCHGGLEIGFDPLPVLTSSLDDVYVLLKELEREKGFNRLSSAVKKTLHTSSNPQDIKALKKDVDLEQQRQNQLFYTNIGFMWNDTHVDPQSLLTYNQFRGFKLGKLITRNILDVTAENVEVVGMLRAHQHGDREMMNAIKKGDGISRLWSDDISDEDKKRGLWRGIVCTFSVAPDAGYGKAYGINYDAFGILNLAGTFEECSLDVFQIQDNQLYAVPKKPVAEKPGLPVQQIAQQEKIIKQPQAAESVKKATPSPVVPQIAVPTKPKISLKEAIKEEYLEKKRGIVPPVAAPVKPDKGLKAYIIEEYLDQPQPSTRVFELGQVIPVPDVQQLCSFSNNNTFQKGEFVVAMRSGGAYSIALVLEAGSKPLLLLSEVDPKTYQFLHKESAAERIGKFKNAATINFTRPKKMTLEFSSLVPGAMISNGLFEQRKFSTARVGDFVAVPRSSGGETLGFVIDKGAVVMFGVNSTTVGADFSIMAKSAPLEYEGFFMRHLLVSPAFKVGDIMPQHIAEQWFVFGQAAVKQGDIVAVLVSANSGDMAVIGKIVNIGPSIEVEIGKHTPTLKLDMEKIGVLKQNALIMLHDGK